MRKLIVREMEWSRIVRYAQALQEPMDQIGPSFPVIENPYGLEQPQLSFPFPIPQFSELPEVKEESALPDRLD